MSFIATATREPPTNGAAPSRPGSVYVLSFGKHKGTPIDRVPSDYLRWVLYKSDRVGSDDELRRECEAQLGLLPGSTKVAPEEEIRALSADLNRMKAAMKLMIEERDDLRRRLLMTETTLRALRDHARPAAVNINKGPKVESLRGILKGLYRKMVLEHHPDRGGNGEAMRIVVDVFKSLDEEIATWEKS